MTAKKMLGTFEAFVLIVCPLFIILSLRDFISFPAFILAALLSAGLLRLIRRRGPGLFEASLLYLLFLTTTAYVIAVWNIYHIGTLYAYPDTAVYTYQSRLGLTDPSFWLQVGGRPFVTPLIFKVFRQDLGRINMFFILIYLLSTLFFIFVLTRYFGRIHERLAAGYAFLLLFLNQHSISLWLGCGLSEIPSIVSTLLILSLCGLFYAHREALDRRRGGGYLAAATLVPAVILFAFSRDANAYFLPCLLFFFMLIFKRWPARIILAGCVILVFLASVKLADSAGRWKLPLQNVMQWRIIPDNQLRRLFYYRYHLPRDKYVLPCAKIWASKPCKNKKYVLAWIDDYGLGSYRHFLLTHPKYVFGEWRKSWAVFQEELWVLEFQPEYYAHSAVRPKKLNGFIFDFPGYVSFPLALLTLLAGVVIMRKNPLILLWIAHSFFVGLIAFHGDYIEVSRHGQQATMTLKMAFLLCLLQLYTIIRKKLSGREAHQEEPDLPAE